MINIKVKCPECNQFEIFTIDICKRYKKEIDKINNKKNDKNSNYNKTDSEDELIIGYAASTCPSCFQAILVVFKTKYKYFEDALKNLSNFSLQNFSDRFKIIKIYPEPKVAFSHDSIPEHINNKFKVAYENFAYDIDYSVTVAVCRGILELIINDIKLKDSSEKTKKKPNLNDKIKILFQDNILTKTLTDWAHQIRIEGNKAIHEMSSTREEAEEILQFTEVFLQYIYVMPAKIEELNIKRT